MAGTRKGTKRKVPTKKEDKKKFGKWKYRGNTVYFTNKGASERFKSAIFRWGGGMVIAPFGQLSYLIIQAHVTKVYFFNYQNV